MARNFIQNVKNYMTDKLVDTNILVYAYDLTEREKHQTSSAFLKQIWKEGGGVVCLQNLMEFFAIITKKVENPIEVEEAKTIVEDFKNSENWRIIDRDVDTFFHAMDIVSEHKIHVWDAMIAACMKENNINEIVTENVKDFNRVPNIKVSSLF